MVDVIKPQPGATICDPACGTGGFILASHDYISKHFSLDIEQKKALRSKTFKGWEIVDNAARLCVMNLYLHGIGGEESPIIVADALASDPGERFDVVLTNPPFGKKSSYTIVNGEGSASMYLYVENADAVFEKAVSAGSRVTMPIADTFWGDRAGGIVDPFGHSWMVGKRIKELSDKEIEEASKAMFARKP